MRLKRSPGNRPATKRPRLGLRARASRSTFALGAALLSAAMSVITFGLTRENLLNQREETAVSQAAQNAGKIADSLEPTGSQTIECNANTIEDNLSSLTTPGGAQVVLRCNNTWHSANALFDQNDIPGTLVERVGENQPARMRTDYEGEPLLITGVPITALEGIDAQYYEGQSLGELETTLSGLGISLLGASALTTLAGGLLGFWASRRVVRPVDRRGPRRRRESQAVDSTRGFRPARIPTSIVWLHRSITWRLHSRTASTATPRFASEVSHELRSPLMTMSATVEVLENMPRRPTRAGPDSTRPALGRRRSLPTARRGPTRDLTLRCRRHQAPPRGGARGRNGHPGGERDRRRRRGSDVRRGRERRGGTRRQTTVCASWPTCSTTPRSTPAARPA